MIRCALIALFCAGCAPTIKIDPMAELLALQGNDLARIEKKIDETNARLKASAQWEKAIHSEITIQGMATK
jgi:hypothetical protein